MTLRLLTTLFVVLGLLAPLAACGKRGGELDPPEGSTYPRQYPPPSR